MKAVYFIYKCLVCLTDNDVLQRWLRMGLRLESPICIHRSQFLSLLSLFMQSCSIHLLCGFIFPIHKPTINCLLTSSAVSGMDPQTQPVAARISELLAIREHLLDTGYVTEM